MNGWQSAGIHRGGHGAVARGLRAETIKLVTLPALWWTAALTAAASGLTLWAAHASPPQPGRFGFDSLVWSWTMVVQVGFLVAGTLAATSDHVSAQGRTTLLVCPVRWQVAAARLVTLAGAALVAAVVLVAVGVSACPAGWEESARAAGGRTVVWLVAVTLASAGVGGLVRHQAGALTVSLLLVVVAPALAGILGAGSRWLVGVAGRAWVQAGTDAAPTGTSALTAGFTVLAWVVVSQAAGTVRLLRSDA